MENNNSNQNNFVNEFVKELSEITGQCIRLEHIHPSTEGRYYYIQAPRENAPMLLHHYRGPFFLDIHPNDWANISSGKISAHKYIESANWQIGFYLGGGSMLRGGYYHPYDIIDHKDVRNYLKMLARHDYWDDLSEPDPRVEFFEALSERFGQENPGYALKDFFCGEIPEREIWIRPTTRLFYRDGEPFAFKAYCSKNVIQDLLMHETEPGNWIDFAKEFQFRICKRFGQTVDVTPENLEEAKRVWTTRTAKANTQP